MHNTHYRKQGLTDEQIARKETHLKFEKMQVDAQFGLLKIAGGMQLLDTLKQELANVKPKMKPETAYLSYEEIREGVHDDLVLPTALAHWGAHMFQFRPPYMTFRG